MTKGFRVLAAVTAAVALILAIVWLMPHATINFFTEYGEAKEVRWRGLTLRLVEGEIVLPKVTDTELIIRRKTSQDAALMLTAGGQAYAEKMPLVRSLCAQVNCSMLAENEKVINGRKVRAVEYVYELPDKISMREAYYWVNGSSIVLQYRGSNASFGEFAPTLEKTLLAISSAVGK